MLVTFYSYAVISVTSRIILSSHSKLIASKANMAFQAVNLCPWIRLVKAFAIVCGMLDEPTDAAVDGQNLLLRRQDAFYNPDFRMRPLHLNKLVFLSTAPSVHPWLRPWLCPSAAPSVRHA